MSIHIDQVLDYLDSHLVCQNAKDMPSLMAVLCDAYVLHDWADSPENPQSAELRAFSQGVLTGMMLMTEVNRLP